MPITVENCAFFLRTSVPMCLWWNAAHGLRNWYSPQACRRLSARSEAWPKPPAELRDLVLPALGGRGGLTDGQVPSQENPAPPGGSDCPPTPGLAHAAPRSQRGAGDCRGARIAVHGSSKPVSVEVLAERYGLPTRHLEPLLQALVREGILRGSRGPRGGECL